MNEDFEVSRFERELLRRLRALPFEVQQHVSRYILRLQREHGTLPEDPTDRPRLGEPRKPLWNMTHDELAKLREDMGIGPGDAPPNHDADEP